LFPETRLSTQKTFFPCAINESHKWLPIKPAPL